MTSDVTLKELQHLVECYAKAREAKAVVEDSLKTANAAVKEIESQITQTLMDNKQDNFRVSGVGLISLKKYESVPVPKTEMERRSLWKYIADTYGEGVAYSTFSVHAKTLEAFYKQERAKLPKDDQHFFSLPGVGEPAVHYGVSFRSDKE